MKITNKQARKEQRLRAAAPEMLEALQSCVIAFEEACRDWNRDFPNNPQIEKSEAMKKVYAAIAKATGE